ncbi:hypothetical protein S7711_07299 [Stachybotrys chartarum IBT 7711]|uniref:Heterokaryon incompatibility domain-containing protein n=1 Tax=Stachybotrys chartarum (strain CBS 109288 / IBT 7711) TaxID=1280523 RepID=A0A084BA14_STACB|nr:hypothetical protein S7711_07299 [Stachybotrys chartarum IBT 7711]
MSSFGSLHRDDANLDVGASSLMVQNEPGSNTSRWCCTCRNLRFDCPEAIRPTKISYSETDDAQFSQRLKFGELETSALDGCRYCVLVAKVVQDRWPGVPSDADTMLTIGLKRCRIAAFQKSPRVTHSVNIYSARGSRPPWRGIPVRDQPSHYDPDCAFPFLKDCLDVCLTKHTSCSPQDTAFPTRLLQLGATLKDTQVTLVEPAPGTRGHYVALSYCWGGYERLRCMSWNKEMLKHGFQSSQLPQTLQDAVSLTIRLGLRYIWIDSLCIVQDDEVDWERESGRMSDVYGGAYLTIAAASSPSAETGFLTQRAMPETLRIPIEDEYGEPAFVCLQDVLRSGFHGGRLEPWTARGWTLQEELLSSRLIVYTKQELQWTCLSCSRCECDGPIPEFAATNTPLRRLSSAQDAFRMWQRHVVEYSTRCLSFPSDKLPAMAGLAQFFHKIVGCAYVAGLWLDNLIDDLTWCRQGPLHESPVEATPTTYRAPSWSWASVDGSIEYFGRYMGNGLTAEASIVDYAVGGSEMAHAFGSIKQGWVQVRGAVIESRLDTSDRAKPRVRLRGTDVAVNLDAGWDVVSFRKTDTNLEVDANIVTDRETGMIQQGTAAARWAACRPFTDRKQGQQAYCSELHGWPTVWLLQLGRIHFNGSKASNEVFLVLGRAPNDAMDRYQRIGFLKLIHRDQSEWAEPFGKDKVRTVTIV